VLAIAVGFLLIAATEWGRPIWESAVLRYHRYQCLHYSAPSGRVICIETTGAAGQVPTLARCDFEPAATSAIPVPGVTLREPPSIEPLLFMHERRTRSGHRSLVLVRRTTPAIRDSIDLPVSYVLWTVDLDGRHIDWNVAIEVLPHPFSPEKDSAHLKFFAGQPDPNDESHFTIRYEVDGRTGIIDGVLRDDADDPSDVRVELEDRGLVGAGGS
jgi:hypothetical protein